MGFIGYIVIIGVFGLIGRMVSSRLQSKFKEYSNLPTPNGMTGAEVAAKMLRDNGINDVKILQGEGFLTDHYNPLKKVIKLSPPVYQGANVSAAAVAAHECGHAVQHAKKYPFLGFRSAIVPLVQASSRVQSLLFGIGIFFLTVDSPLFIYIAIATFGITALFSVITLPVEFDASNRALDWLNRTNTLPSKEHAAASEALKWAARTYVVGAIAAIAQLAYWLLLLMSSRDRA